MKQLNGFDVVRKAWRTLGFKNQNYLIQRAQQIYNVRNGMLNQTVNR